MASTAHPNRGRRLRLAVAGAAVVTALTAATAAAAPPTRTGDAASMGVAAPIGVQADGLSRLGAGDSGSGTGPRSPFPGFLLDQGRYRTIKAPDPGVELYPLGINNRGQVVGTFSTDTPIVNNTARPHGYLWDRGKVTRIDVPGAVGTGGSGVNNRGQVVGAYSDDAGTVHGYLWDRGRFTTIDVPGAVITQPLDITDRGQVIGFYLDDLTGRPGTIHGYLWERGRLATIDAPDAPVTVPLDINNRGQVVGQLRTDVTVPPADDPGTGGFLLAKGAKGPFTRVGFPGAPKSIATGLNDRGQIVGNYQNPNPTPSRQRDGMPPMSRMS
jgi:probable HAF family extracellular repeat protein